MNQRCKQKIRIINKIFSKEACKIFVVGDYKVGKTSLLDRFLSNTFTDEYDNTLDYMCKQKKLELNGKIYNFLFMDFSFGYSEDRMKQFFEKTKGIMFVYDITDENSFSHISDLFNIFGSSDLKYVPKILVGNKCDLEEDRKVQIEEGEDLARDKRMKFIETSAKDSTNVKTAFNIMIEDVKEYMKNNPEKPKIDNAEKSVFNNPEKDEIKIKEELKQKTSKKKSCCF